MFVFTAIRRRRRRRKDQQQQQHSSSRPSVRVTPLGSSSNTNTNNNTSTNNNTPLGVTDMEKNMPFLYSLARSWAWDAVTFRCRTHPQEAAATDYLGDTALHWAALGKAPRSTVQALLQAYPEAARVANQSGLTPLHVACSYRASSAVVEAILNAYPQAACVIHSRNLHRSTPLHLLCDFGGGSSSSSLMVTTTQPHPRRPPQLFDSVRAVRVLLSCAAGMKSVVMLDQLYERRPLEILNARQNLYQEQRIAETMQTLRRRQRELRREMAQAARNNENTVGDEGRQQQEDDWRERGELQRELLERWEDDIRQYRYTEFWQKASLLLVAEYQHILAAAPDDDDDSPPPIMPACMMEEQKNVEEEEDTTERERAAMIVHAAVGNPSCPYWLQQYAILLYEPLLSVPDGDNFDRLPLHVEALNYSFGNREDGGQRLGQLVRACPEAALVRDRNGCLPLSLALGRNRNITTTNASAAHPLSAGDRAHSDATSRRGSLWTPGLNALIDANPLALLEDDIGLLLADSQDVQKTDTSNDSTNIHQNHGAEDDRLHPHIFFRLSPDALYTVLQANPALLPQNKPQPPHSHS